MTRWYKPAGSPVTLDTVWSRVNKSDECWIWLGSTNGKGYGFMRVGKKSVGVHRIVYELVHGHIPEGMLVLHRCDNPTCCRPEHLFLGTYSDNGIDMTAKGRNIVQTHPERLARGLRNGAHTHPDKRRRGELNGRAILGADRVAEARNLYATGKYKLKDLADKFGMSVSGIHHAIHGKNWKHLTQGVERDGSTD